MKKAFKIPLIVVGIICVLLLAATLIMPPIAKDYFQKHDKELMGRELSIGKLRMNLFFGKVKINDLTLFEEDDKTPFVQFDRFETNIKLWDLLKRRIWVKRAVVSGLKVNVEQDHDWFNFSSLKDHFSSESDTTNNNSSYGLVINEINIENSDIHYADLALGNEFLLRDISVRIPFIDLSDLNTDVGLDLCLSDSATLHTDFRLSNNAENYYINLKLNNLGIDVIEPYLQQNWAVDSLRGSFNLDIEAQGPTDHIMDFDLKGNLVLNQISVKDTQGHDLGAVDSVYADIGYFSLSQNVLELNKLYLSGLNTTYIIDADSVTNFDEFLDSYRKWDEATTDTTVVESDEVVESESMKISIADFNLDHANVTLEDLTLPDAFHYEISDICLSSKDFIHKGNNAIQLQATLNKVGKLNMNWQGKLWEMENHNLTLMLSNVKVSDFSPYAVQMFGFPLENGTLSFRSQNIISNGNLQGVNKLQLAAPKVGDKTKNFHPQYEKVPLKLGLYLLTDKHNNISLDLPISGNLNDPKFSYQQALMKVFSNLLNKVAASPFRLRTDEDNLQYIPFDPLQFDFSSEEYIMIDNVVNTLYSRSDLAIMLEEQVQYETVIQQLCNMQLQRDFYLSKHPELNTKDMDFLTNESIRSIKLNDKELCEFASQYSKKKKLHTKEDVASVAKAVYSEKSEQILPILMQRRNELLSDYLYKVKGLSPEQISVTTIDASLLKSFVKPSRYEMHVMVFEEMDME